LNLPLLAQAPARVLPFGSSQTREHKGRDEMLFPGTIPAASKLPARRMIRGENIEKNSSTLGTLVTRPPAKPGRNCGRACFSVLGMERAVRRAKLYR